MNFYIQNYKKQQAAATELLKMKQQQQQSLEQKTEFASSIKRETAYLTPKKID